MRFEDVTERFSAIIDNPGGRGHGLPMNVALPAMAKARIWQAVYAGYSWSITYEPGVDAWTEDVRRRWVGYSASYRKLGHNSSAQTIYIQGSPWRTFTDAEAACKAVWKQLRSMN